MTDWLAIAVDICRRTDAALGVSNVPRDGVVSGRVARDTEMRIVECPCCGGDGGAEIWSGYDPRDGQATGYWRTCECCEGRREVEVEVEPIEMEDLDA